VQAMSRMGSQAFAPAVEGFLAAEDLELAAADVVDASTDGQRRSLTCSGSRTVRRSASRRPSIRSPRTSASYAASRSSATPAELDTALPGRQLRSMWTIARQSVGDMVRFTCKSMLCWLSVASGQQMDTRSTRYIV
jgi:hypothetical protein